MAATVERDGSKVTMRLLSSLAIVVGALISSTPSRVRLGLGGRRCLWREEEKIMG
jgi:hypothetical protein